MSEYTGYRERVFEDLDDESHLEEERVVVKGPHHNPYPYCTSHGALNKVATWNDGDGGIWRCTGIVEKGDGHREIEEKCGVGVKQVEWEDPLKQRDSVKNSNSGGE